MVTGCRDRGIRQTCRTFRFCIGTHTGWTVIRHRIVLCQQAQGCVRRQVPGTLGLRTEIIRSCTGNGLFRQAVSPQERGR